MSNIREVSRLAGVSIATVSRTLKNPDVVSSKTREIVLKAIEEAGYRPNLLARNFSTGKSHAVVVLVPNVANPFFSRVIRGIEQAAQEKGYSVLLGDTQGKPEREHDYARLGLTNQADGLIQLYSRYPFAEADSALAASVPMVNACERISDDCEIPVVELDNRAAGRAVTRHLVELGHRRIGVITGPTDSPIVRDRMAGFQDVLTEAGIAADAGLIANGDFSMASGANGAKALLAAVAPPTAVFCFNDEMAIGAMHAFRYAGLKVPEDMSVAGFDNIDYASFTNPPLTTINQPAEELGRHSMNALYRLMKGESLEVSRIMLSFTLMVRDSTRPVGGSR
ncbi:LacI family transcriptional regulator [Exilibacterium tricleocarpae]|uniref:LacI family transcriptional regulator n=1 Tax=Exilibacterium tricleocarpae TaxID=2591008 RepID=A0A545SP35_9GAMM|nr:LacI family DNA-binding transcriptional regulator [Exilibacterium tricleocarpae]TQV66721.1 LacI family transcriptional regulator [Exilibacterium tricleocarpae]